MESDLLQEWAKWQPTDPPFVFDGDRSVLASSRSANYVKVSSWSEIHAADDFGEPGDTMLHLGLLPQPFFGDLRHASIFVLLLNPGLGPQDYYGEYEVPEFRNALLANLKQKFDPESIPFLFLDPRFAWHSGFGWWHGKLARVIECLAAIWKVNFATARARLGAKLACIELLPCHSSSFRDAGGWLRKLQSVALARRFVHDVVRPRVERGDAIIIVTRQAKIWNLPEHPHVIRYSGQEARAAHLTPGSKGGKAIVEHLTKSR